MQSKYDKEYYETNKDTILIKRKERYHNKDKYDLDFMKRNKKRCKDNQERRKLIVLNYYSNNDIKCKCCGFKDTRVLGLDHLKGNGSKHKREMNIRNSNELYKWIIKNNFPKGFQVLCINCNNAKGKNKKCPLDHTLY